MQKDVYLHHEDTQACERFSFTPNLTASQWIGEFVARTGMELETGFGALHLSLDGASPLPLTSVVDSYPKRGDLFIIRVFTPTEAVECLPKHEDPAVKMLYVHLFLSKHDADPIATGKCPYSPHLTKEEILKRAVSDSTVALLRKGGELTVQVRWSKKEQRVDLSDVEPIGAYPYLGDIFVIGTPEVTEAAKKLIAEGKATEEGPILDALGEGPEAREKQLNFSEQKLRAVIKEVKDHQEKGNLGLAIKTLEAMLNQPTALGPRLVMLQEAAITYKAAKRRNDEIRCLRQASKICEHDSSKKVEYLRFQKALGEAFFDTKQYEAADETFYRILTFAS